MDLIDIYNLGKPSKKPRYTSRPTSSTPYLPPEQKASMLASLASQAGGTVDTIAKTLDTPGAIFRGALAGKPTSGFSWDGDERVSGVDLLQSYGVLKEDDNPYLKAAAGFAAEVATDPLAMIFGPASALSKGGKAAKAANLLNKAGDAAMARVGIEAASKTATGKRASKFLSNIAPGKTALNPENIKYRPLIGPRSAQATTTLREVAEGTARNADEAAENILKLNNYLEQRGTTYAAEADKKLGGAFGLGYFTPMATFGGEGPVATKALDALDAAGQAMRWSTPSRAFSTVFNQKVAGTFKPDDQLYAMRHFDSLLSEKRAARGLAARHLEKARRIPMSDEAKKLLGSDSLLSEEGNRYLTRIFEKVPTNNDELITNAIGRNQIEDLANSWTSIRQDNARLAKELGMKSKQWSDYRYGGQYSPREAIEADFGEYGKNMSRAVYNADVLGNEMRQVHLITPGGTDDLREISQLKKVQEFLASKREGSDRVSIQEMGAEIKKFLDDRHGTVAGRAKPDGRSGDFNTYVKKIDKDGLPIKEDVIVDGEVAMRRVRDKKTGKVTEVPRQRFVYETDQAITQEQGEKIARLMQRISVDNPTDNPLFSSHPLSAQAKNIVSQAAARGNVKSVIASLGESALEESANVGEASRRFVMKPLVSAMNDVASHIGVQTGKGGIPTKQFQEQLREQIANRLGRSVDEIDLTKFSVPENVTDRLQRVNDFYSSPRAQQKAIEFLNMYSQVFKGFLLAMPSTKVRDMYSNAFSVWLEVGDAANTVWGFNTAKKVLAGKFDEVEQSLKQIPGYSNVSGQQLREKFVTDVASTDILAGLSSSDLMTSNRAAAVSQLLPGANPAKQLDFFQNLKPTAATRPAQVAKDYFTFKGVRLPGQATKASETKNAFLNASQQISDYNDSVARLGGMLAMMKKGNDPQHAADRITEILVDYQSLTPIERNLLRFIFPWYSYNSRIGYAVAKQIAAQPGGAYAQTLRGLRVLQQGDGEVYIPESTRQQAAVRLPEGFANALGFDNEEGQFTVVKDFDVPGTDTLNLIDKDRPVSGTMMNLVNQSNPLIKFIGEQSTGMDFFSRRPLEQATTPMDRLYKKVFQTDQNMNPLARSLLNLTPAPRAMGILGGMADERLPLPARGLKQAVNSLTGVKFQTVDPAWSLNEARSKAMQQLKPWVRNYSMEVIPKALQEEIPESLQPTLGLTKELDRDINAIRKLKRARDEAKKL